MQRRVGRALLVGLAAGLVALFALRTWVVGVFEVTSPSMAPTLLVGDRVLVTEWGYPGRLPVRGDVVVFRRPGSPRQVKRVLGLPGDHVSIRASAVFVNGTPVAREPLGEASFDASGATVRQAIPFPERALFRESFAGRRWEVAQRREARAVNGDWTVPFGALFVAGDNRDASDDSRDPRIGFVPVGEVIGRVMRVVYSTAPVGWRAHTWVGVR